MVLWMNLSCSLKRYTIYFLLGIFCSNCIFFFVSINLTLLSTSFILCYSYRFHLFFMLPLPSSFILRDHYRLLRLFFVLPLPFSSFILCYQYLLCLFCMPPLLSSFILCYHYRLLHLFFILPLPSSFILYYHYLRLFYSSYTFSFVGINLILPFLSFISLWLYFLFR